MYAGAGAKCYGAVQNQTGVVDADPHRLIMMLMDGALDRISLAKGYIQRKDAKGRGESIGAAISIIGGLQNSLDKEKGGEIAANLDRLYEYMGTRLLDASIKEDVAVLDEVSGLIREIRSGWEGIREAALAQQAAD